MIVERRTAVLKQQRSIETREALLLGAARAFSQLSYSATRLRHIAAESGISEGALYFHFGTKAEIAKAVLDEQHRRMSEVLQEIDATSDTGLNKLSSLSRRMAKLIAEDELVQGGVRLGSQRDPELVNIASEPYFVWVARARALIAEGVGDGSISPDVDVAAAAEHVNAAFIGAQVLAGLADGWKSLPMRVEQLLPYLTLPLRRPSG